MVATFPADLLNRGPIASLFLPSFIRSLFSTDYLPHRFCYLAQPWLVWSNVTADTIITVSYVAIFLSLLWLGSRIRCLPQVRPYVWICLSFGSFIIACGATHLMETVTVWHPVYRLAVAIKIVCAVASAGTACLLVSRISALAHSVERLIEIIDSDHRQAEALRKSEALLDRTNRVAGIGGWELDLLTSQVTWANETARMHGLPVGYRPTLEEGINYYAPEFHPTIHAALQTAMAGGKGWDLEVPLVRVDGRRIWVRLVGEAEIVNGKPVRLFGFLQDKTKEIEQREALRRSELLLDRANQVAGMGGWELDLITNEVAWSSQTARIHGFESGYKPNLEEGLNYFTPDGQPTLHERMQRAMSGGGGWEAEVTLIRADGARRQARHLGEVEFLEGKPIKLFGSLQDITEETQQREALRKAQLFLDRTNQVAGIGGWEFDLITKELTWSDQTARIHGMLPGHKPTYEESLTFFPPGYHASILAAVESAVATNSRYELELPLFRPDGQRIWVSLVGETELADGKPVRIFGSLQDKTLAVEQREALRTSQEFLDRTTRISGVGGWEVDIASGKVTWSAETFRIHALPETHIPTVATAIAFYAEQDRPIITAAIERALETGAPWDLELQFVRADQRPIWVRTSGAVETRGGRPIRIVGAIQDKTLEIEQREIIRKSQLFLDRTNSIAGVGGWEVDIATGTVTWSAQTYRIHAMPLSHVPTLATGLACFADQDRPIITAAVERAIQTGEAWDLELRLIRADGESIPVRTVGTVEMQDGQPIRIVGAIQDLTSEVDQREAFRKSQTFLDRTNRIAGVGGWEVDLATGQVTWSAETYRIHGLPRTFVPSVPTGLSFYVEEDRPIIAAAIEHAIATGEGWDLELRVKRADGRLIWVRVVGNAEMQDGKPVRLVGAFQDKTAQVEVRNALQHANERLTLATDGGGIGIWDWDIASNSFICDAWMFRLHGLEYAAGPSEMALWTSRLHPEDRPLTVAALLDALEGKSRYFTEFRVIWNDGSTHTIQASGEVFRDSDGRAIRMVGIHRDITEAQRLTNQLQQQHELLFSIGDAVIALDAAHNIRWMNGAAERMIGWEACDATGKPASDVISIVFEDSRLPARVYVDPAIARSRRIGPNEKAILISRDGSEHSIESCATPIYDNRAELAGSVIVISDTSEHQRHVRETQQISKLQLDLKLKDEFLSHVSHELRSPLTSVYSFTSIVADNLAGDTTPEQQDYLQIVLKNVLQLQAMIEDLLTVTQSREGKLSIDLQDVPVAPTILDAINTTRYSAGSKQITMAACDCTGVPDAWSDPTRLRQIMIILLDNAIKFTPEEGHIHIRVVEDGTMLRFEVEDSGCGIPLDKRARIFEKLYQITAAGHADTSQQGRIGLGLGLHIARDLVRRQGGNIWVSGDPDQGSIFNFTLPLASEAAELASSPLRRKTDWPESVAK